MTSKKTFSCNTGRHFFSNKSTSSAISARIFRNFAKVYSHFAQTSTNLRDFSRILTKSKLLAVRSRFAHHRSQQSTKRRPLTCTSNARRLWSTERSWTRRRLLVADPGWTGPCRDIWAGRQGCWRRRRPSGSGTSLSGSWKPWKGQDNVMSSGPRVYWNKKAGRVLTDKANDDSRAWQTQTSLINLQFDCNLQNVRFNLCTNFWRLKQTYFFLLFFWQEIPSCFRKYLSISSVPVFKPVPR